MSTPEATPDTDNPRPDEPEERDPPEAQREPDHYAVLGLPPDASREQIRAAYRRLVKRWHPDRWSGAPPVARERAERRMRRLTAAYAILGDEARRHDYDARRGLFRGWSGAPFPERAVPSVDEEDNFFSPPRERGNPNGAGQFAGTLALILALSLFIGAITGGIGATPGAMLIFGGIAALLIVGAIFFYSSSSLARAATAWMEGEPRGFDPRYDVPPSPAAARGDADGEDAGAARVERLVDEALAHVPAEFGPHLANLVVRVEDEPSPETLRESGVPPGGTLFGLYHGVPLTKQGIDGAFAPEVISIYRGPIERYCGDDPDEIREQVRATVLHEIAHHFGIDHDDMPEWVK